MLFDPDTIFIILLNLFFLSPGLILSGLYPQKKSELSFKLDILSIIGMNVVYEDTADQLLDNITKTDYRNY